LKQRSIRATAESAALSLFGGNAVAVLKLFDQFIALLAKIVRLVCIVLTIALFTIVVIAIVARYGFGQAVHGLRKCHATS